MSKNDKKRLVLTVMEAAKLLRLSRGLAYEGVRLGQIPSIHIGRRVLIPRAALQRLLDGGFSDSSGKPENSREDQAEKRDRRDIMTQRKQVK